MEQRSPSRLNRDLSVIGLGTWQLGADWGDVEDEAATAVLDAARSAGVTFFDTADVYGDGRSEKFIGNYMKNNGSENLTVATKMGRRADPHVPEAFTLDNFRAWTDRSRENLGARSEEHTSELQSRGHLVCRLLLEKKKTKERLSGSNWCHAIT